MWFEILVLVEADLKKRGINWHVASQREEINIEGMQKTQGA